MTNQTPRPMTNDDLQEIQNIWRRIKALRMLKATALPGDHPGAWIAEAAEKALELDFARLDALYRETHPTLPTLEP